MKKLWDITEVVTDNKECVVFKVKEGSEMDLISLGCFDGDETMFRITKKGDHTFTIWTVGNRHFSWYWGLRGHTIVAERHHQQRIQLMQLARVKGIDLN